jgi:2-dehydropantoate 2-reductase
MAQHWHILGAGSIGLLWAAHLAQAGHPITLLLRNEDKLSQFAAANGLQLEANGHITSVAVDAQVAAATHRIDHLLVTTKAYDTLEAIGTVTHALHADTEVVVLQNGMGAQAQAAALLAPRPVWAASTTDGAWLRAPFHVVYAGRGETRIGPLSENGPAALPAGLRIDCGLQITPDSDILLTLWRKLAINCAINPLTALYNCRNGELVSCPDKHQHMAALCREIEQLATVMGLHLFAEGVLAQAERVAHATAENYSSMLQDIRHGRRSELEQITGYLLHEAEQHGVQLPVNRALYTEVSGLQRA